MHASGITVDESAKSSFISASTDASCLYVKYQIRGESFVAVGGRGSTQQSLVANFQEIQKACAEQPNEPAFIVARNISREAGKWLVIFFMPEGCTVRDRMVYAASAGALKDGLGQSNFDAATFSVSKVSECTAADYEAESRSMSHDDLLTLDEKAKLAGETESAKAMSSTRSQAIAGLPIKASDESLEALAAVKKGSPNTVILQLNANNDTLLVQQAGQFTFEQVQSKLPANEPRYIVQNFAHEHDGAQVSAIIFVYYCPEDTKAKNKMVYSTCKSMVVKVAETSGLEIKRSIEMSETKELNTASMLEELYPQTTAKKTFKKPARPGRGNARLITSPDSAAASSSPSP